MMEPQGKSGGKGMGIDRLRFRPALAVFLAAFGLIGWTPPVYGQGLRVEIIQDIGQLKVRKKGVVTKPVVEVRDENNTPVAGAIVVFSVRQGSASAQFVSTNSAFVEVATDSAGRAATSLQVNSPGNLTVNVNASSQGRTGSALLNGNVIEGAAISAVGLGVGLAAAAAGVGTLVYFATKERDPSRAGSPVFLPVQ
jgi:hypothetical protein